MNIFLLNHQQKCKYNFLSYKVSYFNYFSTPIGSGTTIEKKKVSSNETSTPTPSTPLTPEEEEEQKLGIKSSMAKNIFRILFRPPPRRVNELFLPHRMAYIIDLENLTGQQDDDNGKGTHPLDDIPTTLIRSKADCPNAEVYKNHFKKLILHFYL
jgi:hypothetical protein